MKIGIVTASIYETIMPACDMLIRMMQYPTNPTPMHVERKKKKKEKNMSVLYSYLSKHTS